MAKTTSKSEILKSLASSTKLSRKQVSMVFEGLALLIKKDLSKKGPGAFVVPGLMKLVVIQKPAVPERTGINPFTKMEQTFKAKPARKVVKVRPLKALKEMVR
jgi:nucleoid DNA-binding protein